ncbi:MAG: hypothetical protein QXH12_08875 [Candidatus Caldarchaeum sp.]
MKAVSENTSETAGVRGSSGGSSVPPRRNSYTKVYHEENGELIYFDELWEAVYEIISSGRFQPTSITIDEYPHGRFENREYNLRVFVKNWIPNPGLSWSESVVYLEGER